MLRALARLYRDRRHLKRISQPDGPEWFVVQHNRIVASPFYDKADARAVLEAK